MACLGLQVWAVGNTAPTVWSSLVLSLLPPNDVNFNSASQRAFENERRAWRTHLSERGCLGVCSWIFGGFPYLPKSFLIDPGCKTAFKEIKRTEAVSNRGLKNGEAINMIHELMASHWLTTERKTNVGLLKQGEPPSKWFQLLFLLSGVFLSNTHPYVVVYCPCRKTLFEDSKESCPKLFKQTRSPVHRSKSKNLVQKGLEQIVPRSSVWGPPWIPASSSSSAIDGR